MKGSDYTTRRHILMIIAVTALFSIVAGFTIGFLVGRADTALAESCADALAAAEEIVVAVDGEWATASAAVDAAQTAVAESGFREHAASCRDA